ncbi:TPA: hypothetical protein DCZ46_00865 [Candidatus Campbellbacteria bacterium]|nr:MAG: hypothetical protein UR74_C0001G0219 [Candidatus Campbellbacteria bacterium GW2011_GWD2_35_24]KKP76076.1 MAG: hypothetical protein UR75_C0001G0110 [Candidatus Campbellbacteria bacterium GW2011_GWC2_35_28]KKP77265.1 MAG: hypothetical protein UR76_C0001G0110 [Candidatus Campbellbacteria bacterium GW2011_GWC1_35_31]KKP79194.1 MAG: hypothetical protein UR79_C0001G0110 [Candidatus Campbellbacteria bacterium GW2011_GWD1_35_49]HAP73807.1 hypothetical protein [Candidatus Campbellbacteria bacter
MKKIGLLFFIFLTLSYGVAVSGEVVGNSYIISAVALDPNTSECSELWWPFKQEAELFADKIGSPKTVLVGPDEQTILSSVPEGGASFVFNAGHSAGPDDFKTTCDTTWIPATALPPSDLLIAYGCTTMNAEGPGTFASTAKAIVGFVDLASPTCLDCLNHSLPFITEILNGLGNGNMVGDAFNNAGLMFPECVDTGCAQLGGDPTVKIYTPPAECGDRATSYATHETEWSSDSVWCKFGSSEETPPFPEPGKSVSWVCIQSDGTTAQCAATKDARKNISYYMPVILSAGKNRK